MELKHCFPHSAHRWLLGEHKVLGLHTWFQLHRALQLTGTVVFLVGLVYAWVYLGIRPKGTPLRKAHGGVGTAVVATTLLQVRPSPLQAHLKSCGAGATQWQLGLPASFAVGNRKLRCSHKPRS